MYVLRDGANTPPQYNITDTLHVRYMARTRPTGRTIGGLFQEVESAGVDDEVLQIAASMATGESTDARGFPPHRFTAYTRRRTTEVHKRLRTIRDDDAAAIDAIDTEIEELRKRIAAKRTERYTAVQRAWRRGREVPLPDVVAIAEANRR